MTRASATLIAACAALLLGGTTACDAPDRHAVIKGDTVYLPAAATLVTEKRTTPDKLPFVKFDGEYPNDWPRVARLPEGSYLNPDGKLAWSEDYSVRHGNYQGICKGRQGEIISAWKGRILAAGWKINKVYDDDGAAYPTGQGAGDTCVLAEGPGSSPLSSYMQLTVWKHRNMDGWVYFDCRFYIDR